MTNRKGVNVPTKSDYKILQRERWTFLDARGNPTDGYRVTFEMPDGTVDWVDVPKKQYKKATVDKAIEAAIAIHLAVVS